MKQCQEQLLRKKNSIIENLQSTEKSLLQKVNTNPKIWNREYFEFNLNSQATLVLEADVMVQDPVQMNRTCTKTRDLTQSHGMLWPKNRLAETLTGGGVVEVTLKAEHSYTAADDDELSFEEGDEIVKLSEPDSEGKIHFYYETRIISRVDRRKTSANGCNSSISDRIC